MFENDILINEEDMLNKEIEMDVEIEKIRFYNEENNYHAMVVSTNKNVIGSKYQYGKYIVTLVGHCVTCTEGDHCKVKAKLVKHPTYGYQYEIVTLGFEAPLDKTSLKIYLSAIIDGARAEILYNAYPDIVDRVMEDPEFEPEYKILKGIARKTWIRIRNKIIENFGYNELITLLAPVGCTLTMIKRIADKEKNLSLVKEKIIKNPYVLCQFPRMGFKKVDGYAIKLNPNLVHSKDRVTQCISYILDKVANDDGHCYIDIKKLKELFKKEILDAELLPIFDQVIEDNRRATEEGIKSEFYVSNDSIGLTSVNALESGIMRILDEIQHRDIIWEYDYKTLFERMEESAKEQGFYLSEEQTQCVRSIAYNNVNVISGKAGCVDCDTEYFNGYEWVKISDYKEGDKVLSYNIETQEGILDYPELYHKYPCDKLWHFETKYGLDQCLCDDHNVVYLTSKGNIGKKKFSEFKKQHESSERGFQGRFLTSFKYSQKGIDLTDELIRVMVAVISDGSFYYQAEEDWDSYYRCRFHIKKDRKKERLVKLFKDASLPWWTKESAEFGYTDFYIDAPRREKVFSKDYWYNCNQHQLEIICDELSYWDGDFNLVGTSKKRFFTNVKETADFVQFVYSACGYRSTIKILDRVGTNHKVGEKEYPYKTIEYSILGTKRTTVGMARRTDLGKEKVKIEPYKTIDGYKYCFTMPLGTLILRRNGKIFITGNCGKTSVIKTILSVYRNKRIAMCALSAKAAKRMSEVTGMYASTIHKLLSVQFNGEENSGFQYNASNPLPYDLIIVDECSMNNIYLLHSLLKAVSKTAKIIFCGDIAQLPSIGTGSVFTDLVQNPIFNNHSFTKVYRQSEESFINTHANLIREGIMPFDIESGNMKFGEDTMYLFRNESEDVRNTAVSLYLEFLNRGYDITDVGIICPRKNNCCVSCSSLNNIIQNHLLGNEPQQIVLGKAADSENEEDSEQKLFKLGARIINKKNDYKKGILNGDTGTVVSINPKGTAFSVKFDNDNLVEFTRSEMATLELGYAISVHSAQGSQYKACIVALDMNSYTLLSSNLIYTAITRAINTMIVCSQPSAFSRAVTNTKENFRNTYLKGMLQNKPKEEYIKNFAQQTMFHKPIVDEETKNIYISEGVVKLATDDPFSYDDSELPF